MRWPDQTSALCSVLWTLSEFIVLWKLLRRVQGGCVSEEDTGGCRFWWRAVAPQSASCNSSWKSGRSGAKRGPTNYKRVVVVSVCSAVLPWWNHYTNRKCIHSRSTVHVGLILVQSDTNAVLRCTLCLCPLLLSETAAESRPIFVYPAIVITEIRPPILPTIGYWPVTLPHLGLSPLSI